MGGRAARSSCPLRLERLLLWLLGLCSWTAALRGKRAGAAALPCAASPQPARPWGKFAVEASSLRRLPPVAPRCPSAYGPNGAPSPAPRKQNPVQRRGGVEGGGKVPGSGAVSEPGWGGAGKGALRGKQRPRWRPSCSERRRLPGKCVLGNPGCAGIFWTVAL